MEFPATGLGEAAPHPNERKWIEDIVEANAMMMEKTNGEKKRAQHPKAHGCLEADFTVILTQTAGLPEQDLHTGVFAEPLTYKSLIRFSNGAKSDDSASDGDAHGMAIKLLDVPGERVIEGVDDLGGHDFILLDNETFFDGDLRTYAIFNDLFAEIVSAKRNDEKRLQGLLNGLWLKYVRKIFRDDLLEPALAVSDQKPVSPLRAKYWSTTPYLLGERAVKYMVVPDPAPSEAELTQGVTTPDGLSERLRADLAKSPAGFDFRLHVQNDPQQQPLEDPTVNWSEKGAHEVKVARIDIRPTGNMSDAEWAEVQDRAERIAFNPANVLKAHRPLGAINRARGEVYRELLRLRRSKAA